MIIDNLANLGVLSDTIEVLLAVLLMIGGIYITYLIQKWADKAGEPPPAANVGRGGAAETMEPRGLRR